MAKEFEMIDVDVYEDKDTGLPIPPTGHFYKVGDKTLFKFTDSVEIFIGSLKGAQQILMAVCVARLWFKDRAEFHEREARRMKICEARLWRHQKVDEYRAAERKWREWGCGWSPNNWGPRVDE